MKTINANDKRRQDTITVELPFTLLLGEGIIAQKHTTINYINLVFLERRGSRE
jgi:hypothetical protein